MKRVLSREVERLIGQTVTMRGWAQTIRRHSKVAFIDLRDRTGLTQVVVDQSQMSQIETISVESVLTAIGKIIARPQSLVNPNIVSGKVELQLSQLTVESLAKPLPFDPNLPGVNEETRLKYRYLDLRSKRLTGHLRQRQQVNEYSRQFFASREFTEVETPYISKSTPEGARDYLIPSRIEPGSFYALPQSPQQYKQLLMVGGVERYYQITRCFRDEDLRGDRQPEFTQLDLELSFTDQDEILLLIEEWLMGLISKLYPEKSLTFTGIPRLKYAEVIAKHQTDRPDLRLDPTNGDELAIAYIVDFPLFEWKEKEKRFEAVHHPFTSPQAEWLDQFEKHPKEALAEQYDLVINGFEIGGGSIRIHQRPLLERVFRFLGHDEEQIQSQFGHLLEAFDYGAPPHGGIALGLDRLLAVLLNQPSIREVIAFPKAGDGRDLMMNAPAKIDPRQLLELGLQPSKKK